MYFFLQERLSILSTDDILIIPRAENRLFRSPIQFPYRNKFSAVPRQSFSSINSINLYILIRIQVKSKQIPSIDTFLPTYYQPDILYPGTPTRRINRLKPTFFSDASKHLGVFFHFPRKINPFMRSKNFFLPVFFQFKMHQKCIFCAYTDRKADIHPFSYAKTSLDYPNLKTYQSGKQIKYKQKESKITNNITQRKNCIRQ